MQLHNHLNYKRKIYNFFSTNGQVFGAQIISHGFLLVIFYNYDLNTVRIQFFFIFQLSLIYVVLTDVYTINTRRCTSSRFFFVSSHNHTHGDATPKVWAINTLIDIVATECQILMLVFTRRKCGLYLSILWVLPIITSNLHSQTFIFSHI